MENIILMGDLKRRVNEKREKVRGEVGGGGNRRKNNARINYSFATFLREELIYVLNDNSVIVRNKIFSIKNQIGSNPRSKFAGLFRLGKNKFTECLVGIAIKA